jgi:hypothetical protein
MMRLAEKTKYKDADGLRQAVISDLLEKPSPSSAASFYQNGRIVVSYFKSLMISLFSA